MVAATYYIGLVLWSVLITLTGFLTKEQEHRVAASFLLLYLYLLLGGYLFGWKIGLANVVIMVVIGTLLHRPIKRQVKSIYPQATYRDAMNPEWRRKFAQWGVKLGLNKRKI
jgi:NhaP-type Na+/H+ or K+/H+ antiporter